ncbi:MAG: capsular biosynthesis protein, partial [Pseudomonas sp.]|nr:capsular biosynthesis protein [Pseudomonas sp.]
MTVKLLLVISLSMLLQACLFAPGQTMDTAAMTSANGAQGVDFIAITPKSIAMDAAAAEQHPVPAPLLAYSPDGYRIGPNDVLYITV